MSTRRLAIATWTVAILATGLWWPASYRHSLGFVALGPELPSRPGTAARPRPGGIALVSGVGKAVAYLSWSSGFTRRGFILEPVLAHEFPHPWLGLQKEGGRVWVSFPIGGVFLLTLLGAAWHLRRAGKRE